jgi:hypothetical protein
MAGGEAGVTLGQPHLSRQDLATLVRFSFLNCYVKSIVGKALGLGCPGSFGARERRPVIPTVFQSVTKPWNRELVVEALLMWLFFFFKPQTV